MYVLAIIGGVVGLASHFFWIRGILKGTMHLNLATWVLWSIFDISVFVSSVMAGAHAPFLAAAYAVGATLVAITLLFKGTWRWGLLETVCTIIALACFFIWYAMGPLLALIGLLIGKYFAAGVPTLVSAHRHPESQQKWVWWMGAFGAATNIWAGGSWNIAQSLFPSLGFIFSLLTGILHARTPLASREDAR